MAASVAEEAIALLIDLAEQGEINPWDIDVIDVIDRFLVQVSPTANTHDLSESGQAFFYAAMLVYLKAMALQDPGQAESESDPEEAFEDPTPLLNWKPIELDKILQPRAVPRLHRTRPVTLKELIHHLQELETVLHDRDPSPPKPSQRISRKKALAAITQLAHPENLLETTAELESLLAQIWQQGLGSLNFEKLVEYFSQAHAEFLAARHPDPAPAHPSSNPHKIQVFWSLLLMAARSQVELRQDVFYEDLTILPYQPISEDG